MLQKLKASMVNWDKPGTHTDSTWAPAANVDLTNAHSLFHTLGIPVSSGLGLGFVAGFVRTSGTVRQSCSLSQGMRQLAQQSGRDATGIIKKLSLPKLVKGSQHHIIHSSLKDLARNCSKRVIRIVIA